MHNNPESIVKENIEMKLLPSVLEPPLLTQTQKDHTATPRPRPLEHPLVQCTEEVPASSTADHNTLIEMEDLHSVKMCNTKTVCENKAAGLKWKLPPPQRSRFVVKDVVFLPKDQYLAQIESLVFTQRREVSPVRARLTVDHSWSPEQMDSRLRLLLRREFGKAVARGTVFTYLQRVQSSRSLYVPSVPVEGWSGAQVLQLSGLGPLYVLIQQEPSPERPSSDSSENRITSCSNISSEDLTDHVSTDRAEELRKELETALTLFIGESPGAELPLEVRRDAALPSALKAIRRSGFCFRSTPVVSFCGEETEGHQGPLREFFRLTLQELQRSSLFEGQPGRRLLTCDLSALENWRYYEAGLLIGWSLTHGGSGPRCLHPALYQLMCGHSPPLHDFNWRDVVDIEAQSHLQQLQTCTDVRQLSPALCDWVSSCGVPEVSCAGPEELPHIYRRVVKYHIYDRVSRMIDQLTEGLNSCDGLWDVMRTHWEGFAPVMTAASPEPLKLADFRRLFTVSYNSDHEGAERETVAYWETVLGHVSDGEQHLSFEDLLTFITGVDHLPPLGFTSPITLRFFSQDAQSSVRLPFASTCTLELFLPLQVGSAAELVLLLTRAVRESQGFTSLNKY